LSFRKGLFVSIPILKILRLWRKHLKDLRMRDIRERLARRKRSLSGGGGLAENRSPEVDSNSENREPEG
jgi:hypothetical protein